MTAYTLDKLAPSQRAKLQTITLERHQTGKRDQVRIILGIEMQKELGIQAGDSVLVTVKNSVFGPAIVLQKSDCKAAYKAARVSKTSTALHIRIAASKFGLPIRTGKFKNLPGWENLTETSLTVQNGPNKIIVPLPEIVMQSDKTLQELLNQYDDYDVLDQGTQHYRVKGEPSQKAEKVGIFGRLFV